MPGPITAIGSPETLEWYNDTMTILSKRFADAVVAAIPSDGYRRPEAFEHEADMISFGQAQFPRANARPPGNVPQVQLPRVNALTFDNVALVVIPGEMFNTFGEMMHAQSPLEHLLLVGYGAGGMGYVPPVVGYEEGGYETHGAVAQGTRGLDIARKVTEILDRLVTLANERDETEGARRADKPPASRNACIAESRHTFFTRLAVSLTGPFLRSRPL